MGLVISGVAMAEVPRSEGTSPRGRGEGRPFDDVLHGAEVREDRAQVEESHGKEAGVGNLAQGQYEGQADAAPKRAPRVAAAIEESEMSTHEADPEAAAGDLQVEEATTSEEWADEPADLRAEAAPSAVRAGESEGEGEADARHTTAGEGVVTEELEAADTEPVSREVVASHVTDEDVEYVPTLRDIRPLAQEDGSSVNGDATDQAPSAAGRLADSPPGPSPSAWSAPPARAPDAPAYDGDGSQVPASTAFAEMEDAGERGEIRANHARVVFGEGTERVALQISTLGDQVKVSARAAAPDLVSAILEAADELHDALAQHGLELADMSSSRESPNHGQAAGGEGANQADQEESQGPGRRTIRVWRIIA